MWCLLSNSANDFGYATAVESRAESDFGAWGVVYEQLGGERGAPFELVAGKYREVAGDGVSCCGGVGAKPFHGFKQASDDGQGKHQRGEEADVSEDENYEGCNHLRCETETEDQSHGKLLERLLSGGSTGADGFPLAV
jgi:hypothetical protein